MFSTIPLDICFSHCLFISKTWLPFGVSTVFKETKTNDIISWIEFTSVMSSRLENLIVMYTMTSYWMEFYRISFSTSVIKGSRYVLNNRMNTQVGHDASRMIFISMLVFMNDKTRVEEVITLSRFEFMEGFVSYPLLPKPQKMLEKAPLIIGSRLQSWDTKKLFTAIETIVANRGFVYIHTYIQYIIHGTEMKWGNMFNMFTTRHLKSPFQLTYLFYL